MPLGSKHELTIGFESWASFGLCEDVRLQCCSLDMFRYDDVAFPLFDHVVDARKKVLTSFVVP